MITNILNIFAIVVAILVIVVALRRGEFRITRSVAISAEPATVFAHVNDLHQWQEFSPWAKLDPAAKNTFEGPPAGIGAVFSWEGNAKVGEGRMIITESRRNELVRFRLDFLKPFKATNIAEFTFKPEGAQTVVLWSMTGKNNFMFKAVGLFMNFDKMIGGDFEKGLATLKSLCEG